MIFDTLACMFLPILTANMYMICRYAYMQVNRYMDIDRSIITYIEELIHGERWMDTQDKITLVRMNTGT